MSGRYDGKGYDVEGITDPACQFETGCWGCGAPLPPRRGKWHSDECRLAFYRDHLWQFARSEAMKRAGRKCVNCGREADEVDHISERNGVPLATWNCLHHQSNLRALCHDCHVNRYKIPALRGETQ